MAAKKEKRQKIKKNLYNKRRLILLNEDTFEEVFSVRLTLMNVFVGVSISAILIIIFTTYLIAFTPLREYIPGYASTTLKRQATELALKSDSLTLAIKKQDAYLLSIKKVLKGELEFAKLNADSIRVDVPLVPDADALKASSSEMQLREELQSSKNKSKK